MKYMAGAGRDATMQIDKKNLPQSTPRSKTLLSCYILCSAQRRDARTR